MGAGLQAAGTQRLQARTLAGAGQSGTSTQP
jgi:hypothetical protein